MASFTPLQGTDLIDCARANSMEGITAAAERCGYGHDLNAFERQLEQACQAIGVDIHSFRDLLVTNTGDRTGVEFAPDSTIQI
ncbi:MAG: hypothetical protein MUF49_31020 [Oculatellaceae cyanobacterium Prado106]|jgi:hypothetical protein|nr:hypothetical protein [Oculatellaceae cyanobacterium Prado106]